MNTLIEEALCNYKIRYPQVEFIRHNENEIFKVTDMLSNKQYIIRIHKSSKRFSSDILRDNENSFNLHMSEINIIRSINKYTDICSQIPVKNKYGDFITKLSDGTLVTMLTWINGKTIDEIELTDKILFELGKMVGKFHKLSKIWVENEKMDRYCYDRKLLKKISFKLVRGIKLKFISNEQFRIIKDAIGRIYEVMDELELRKYSKGIVHCDLAKSNLIVNENGHVIPIDFGLSGISYYYMDLGSLFSHFNKPNQQKWIVNGYKSVINETIEIKYIEAFMVFQIIFFISTHIEDAKEYKWFNTAINKWSRDYFIPFAKKEKIIERSV
ncbi:phosphotransferase [Clostridium sp. BL-8]|uniref:phosphotransferase enzyme family protein n=1 Tax=Clostridium sp. BL-8 TaxID=349938 RepID=UPI00098BE9EA|nr:phosphotransferase [Clostridium sp. BL-8]OOM79413.1 serine/threonine protein kinase [Clostridium sp. BL-8]